MALKHKSGFVFTLLTLILFILMLAEIVTYAYLNLNYNSMIEMQSGSSLVPQLLQSISASMNAFIKNALPNAVNSYVPPHTLLDYPLNNTAARQISLIISSNLGSFTSYLSNEAKAEGATLNFKNQTIMVFQSNPFFINATYSAVLILNSSYGSYVYPVSASTSMALPLAFLNITINNGQSTPTPAPFQQSITFNPSSYSAYESGNLGNIRFYYGNNELYSWCESGCTNTSSSATFWINLPQGVPASSAINITMAFYRIGINYSSYSGKPIALDHAGEAPQLSYTYGKFDNGAEVFNFYDNFAGTALNTNKWSVVGSGGTINNGLSIAMSGGSAGDYVIYSTSTFAPNVIAETLFSTSAFAVNIRTYNPTLSTSNTQKNPAGDAASSPVIDWSINSANSGYWNAQQGSSSAYFASSTNNANPASNWLLGVGYTGSTNYWYGFSGSTPSNYSKYTSSSTDSPTGNLYLGLGAAWSSLSRSITETYTWVRVRAYPPNGVMPTASIGNLNIVK
ncbi:MAG: hypothetical protein ACP5RP_00465 [Candidatus Micrarchaeia archaeon]